MTPLATSPKTQIRMLQTTSAMVPRLLQRLMQRRLPNRCFENLPRRGQDTQYYVMSYDSCILGALLSLGRWSSIFMFQNCPCYGWVWEFLSAESSFCFCPVFICCFMTKSSFQFGLFEWIIVAIWQMMFCLISLKFWWSTVVSSS